ncbi:MAG: hypothetical protein N3C61_01230 [Candidatus Micrarchaeota archaeon]|nr:hypothetical protein [Candidatus Micrarchaeota archaeon]
MIQLKDIIVQYRKERRDIDYVISRFMKDSENYDEYYNRYEKYIELKNLISEIVVDRKKLNTYLRSLSFDEAIRVIHYLNNQGVRMYRLNHYNDFILESFGILKIKDKNLIEFHRSIERIRNMEDFEPPEIDSIGKHNSLFYHTILPGNLNVLDRLIDRENNYYHHGLSMNYYLWHHNMIDRFIDSLSFQSLVIPQYTYVNDEDYDLIHVVCLDDILYLDPHRMLVNVIDEHRDRFMRFTPDSIFHRDLKDLLKEILNIKTLIVFGKIDEPVYIYKSSIQTLAKIGVDTVEFERF